LTSRERRKIENMARRSADRRLCSLAV